MVCSRIWCSQHLHWPAEMEGNFLNYCHALILVSLRPYLQTHVCRHANCPAEREPWHGPLFSLRHSQSRSWPTPGPWPPSWVSIGAGRRQEPGRESTNWHRQAMKLSMQTAFPSLPRSPTEKGGSLSAPIPTAHTALHCT